MAGYDGYSMSNNAREAYEDGYMPKSKWTKATMIEAIKTYIEENLLDDEWNFSINKLSGMSRELLFNTFFIYKEWHHTSSKYNRTDFYGVNEFDVVNMTDEKIDRLISEDKERRASRREKKQEKPEEPQGMYLCEFKHWTGTKKHPKCEIVQAVGEIKGKMFYSSEYGNKRLSADGFKILSKADERVR